MYKSLHTIEHIKLTQKTRGWFQLGELLAMVNELSDRCFETLWPKEWCFSVLTTSKALQCFHCAQELLPRHILWGFCLSCWALLGFGIRNLTCAGWRTLFFPYHMDMHTFLHFVYMCCPKISEWNHCSVSCFDWCVLLVLCLCCCSPNNILTKTLVCQRT